MKSPPTAVLFISFAAWNPWKNLNIWSLHWAVNIQNSWTTTNGHVSHEVSFSFTSFASTRLPHLSDLSQCVNVQVFTRIELAAFRQVTPGPNIKMDHQSQTQVVSPKTSSPTSKPSIPWLSLDASIFTPASSKQAVTCLLCDRQTARLPIPETKKQRPISACGDDRAAAMDKAVWLPSICTSWAKKIRNCFNRGLVNFFVFSLHFYACFTYTSKIK